METKTLSLVLTVEQHNAIARIAQERYSGNMGRAIRAAMEMTYPDVQKAAKVGPVGTPRKSRKKK